MSIINRRFGVYCPYNTELFDITENKHLRRKKLPRRFAMVINSFIDIPIADLYPKGSNGGNNEHAIVSENEQYGFVTEDNGSPLQDIAQKRKAEIPNKSSNKIQRCSLGQSKDEVPSIFEFTKMSDITENNEHLINPPRCLAMVPEQRKVTLNDSAKSTENACTNLPINKINNDLKEIIGEETGQYVMKSSTNLNPCSHIINDISLQHVKDTNDDGKSKEETFSKTIEEETEETDTFQTTKHPIDMKVNNENKLIKKRKVIFNDSERSTANASRNLLPISNVNSDLKETIEPNDEGKSKEKTFSKPIKEEIDTFETIKQLNNWPIDMNVNVENDQHDFNDQLIPKIPSRIILKSTKVTTSIGHIDERREKVELKKKRVYLVPSLLDIVICCSSSKRHGAIEIEAYLKTLFADQYKQAKTHLDRELIVFSTLDLVKETGGKFLKESSKNHGMFYEISDSSAFLKVKEILSYLEHL